MQINKGLKQMNDKGRSNMNTFKKYLTKKIIVEQETLNEDDSPAKLQKLMNSYRMILSSRMVEISTRLIKSEVDSNRFDENKFMARMNRFTNLIEDCYILLGKMKEFEENKNATRTDMDRLLEQYKKYLHTLPKI